MIGRKDFVCLEIDVALPREHGTAGLIRLNGNLHNAKMLAKRNLLCVGHDGPSEQQNRISFEGIHDRCEFFSGYRASRVDTDDFDAKQIL